MKFIYVCYFLKQLTKTNVYKLNKLIHCFQFILFSYLLFIYITKNLHKYIIKEISQKT